MDSLKSFFKRRSWSSSPSTKTLSKSHLHRDSKTPGPSFINEGLGVGMSFFCMEMYLGAPNAVQQLYVKMK